MSISQLLQPNSYNLFGKSLNGITTEEITGTNENGQVLTITNRDQKIVAFTDIPSDIPPTAGFPDGYVLKIIDNTTNEVNWEPDNGAGATLPFILTGDNVNALAVRDTLLDNKLRVDTVDNQIFLSAQQNIINGIDDGSKLAVYTNADSVNPIFKVSTENLNTGVMIGGAQSLNKFLVITETGDTVFNIDNANSETLASGKMLISADPDRQDVLEVVRKVDGTQILRVSTLDNQTGVFIGSQNALEKFAIRDDDLNRVFWVDTINDIVYIGGDANGTKLQVNDANGNAAMYFSTQAQQLIFGHPTLSNDFIFIDYGVGLIKTQAITSGTDYTGFSAQNDGSSSSMKMLTSYDTGEPNKLESIGGSGLVISSNNSIVISSPATSFDASQPIPTIDVLPSQYTDYKEIANILYVNDRAGGISSGVSASATAIGNVVGDQLLNPLSFLPNSPTVPANYLKAGQSYQLTMSGSATFTNGDAFVFSLKSAAVVLGTISISVPNVAGGGQTWECEGDFTIRSITLGLATIVCSFDFTYNDGQDFRGKRSLTTSTTLDTTIANSLSVFVNFSSGQATDNITTELYILKKVVDV